MSMAGKEIIVRLLFALAALAIPFASTPAKGPATPIPSASTIPVPNAAAGAACARSDFHYADEKVKAEAKRLHELPPGNLILAVVRDVDGCQNPVIVRHGYGFGAPQDSGETERPRLRARRW